MSELFPDRKRAEAYMTSIRASTNPYALCIALAQATKAPDACFFALATIKDAMIREWDSLGAAKAAELQAQLFRLLAPKGSSSPVLGSSVIRRQILHVDALITKRAWLSCPQDAAGRREAEKVLSRLGGLVRGSPPARKLGLGLACELLDEFGSAAASPMGVPLAQHHKARFAFQEQCLKGVFIMALRLLQTRAEAMAKGRGIQQRADISEIRLALDLASRALSWPFCDGADLAGCARAWAETEDESDTRGSNSASAQRPFVEPGPTWRPVLLGSGLPVLSALSALYMAPKVRSDDTAAHALRESIHQLASLHGSIFGSDQKIRAQYASALLSRSVALSRQRPVQGQDEDAAASHILGFCRILQKIVTNCSPRILLSLGPNAPRQLFAHLNQTTCALLRVAAAEEATGVQTRRGEALAVMLDLWVAVVADYEYRGRLRSGGYTDQARKQLADAAQAVFSCFVECRMRAAADEIARGREVQAQFDDDEFWASQLEAAGMLARLRSGASLTTLSRLIRERTALLRKAAGGRGKSGSAAGFSAAQTRAIRVAQEQLFWLIRLLGHTLADASEGETPMIPHALVATSADGDQASPDPILSAARAALELASLETQLVRAGRLDETVSPYLAETVVWFLARWVPSYVYANGSLYERISPRIWAALGPGTGGGAAALAAAVDKAVANLLDWPGAMGVAAASAGLLQTLARSREIARALASTPAWRRLARAYATCAPPIMRLLPDALTRLAQALCRVASAAGSDAARELFQAAVTPVQKLLAPFVAAVAKGPVSGKAAAALMGNVAQKRLGAGLALLRGVARTDGRLGFGFGFGVVLRILPSATRLLPVYGPHAETDFIVSAVVGVHADATEAHLGYCSAAQTRVLAVACADLVRAFVAARVGDVGSAAAPAAGDTKKRDDIAEARLETRAEDMTTLLQMLSGFLDPNTDHDDDSAKVAAADTVLRGLASLMRLFDTATLRFPDVCTAFFRLLADAVAKAPLRFAKLTAEARARFVRSIEFALSHHSPDVVRDGLRALRSTALAAIAVARSRGQGAVAVSSELERLLQRLLRLLLAERAAAVLVNPIADALFPIARVSPPEAFARAAKGAAGNLDARMQAALRRVLETAKSAKGSRVERRDAHREAVWALAREAKWSRAPQR